MFKTLITLARGRTAEATAKLQDSNALTLLDQQMRDAAGDLDRARRALAISKAQGQTETRRLETLRGRIADLETRAAAAIGGGREDLALEAAEAIAALETDLVSATAAQTSFARECAKLTTMTTNAERRVAELDRGRRAAQAAEAVRRLRSQGAAAVGGGASALQEAERTLARLRERQREDDAATDALEASSGPGADLVAEKLEAAGFGEASKPNARSVLERLRQRQQASA